MSLKYVNWGELNIKFSKENLNELYLSAVNAVKKESLLLKYIKDQTEEMCLESIKQNPFTIYYVNEQLDEICREALRQNKNTIEYIKDKEKYLEEFDIKYLKKQGKVREVIAIKENEEWLFTVGCQFKMTKEKFIYRIHTDNGGFNLSLGINVHRKVYLNFLEQFD